MKQELSLDSLGDLDDGRAKLIINQALTDAVFDTMDRGHDQKTREVTIKVKLNRSRDSEYVFANVEVGQKFPSRMTADTKTKIVNVDGETKLEFKKDAPEHPDQTTIGDFLPDESNQWEE